jgi:hypothetical protein
MKTMRSRMLATALGAMTLTMLIACAVTGVGVEGSVGYDGGYYEPYGYDYGGWGGTYLVGPGRCCEHRDDHGRDGRDGRDGRGGRDGGGHDGRGGGHAPAYRPAPAGRSAPSIPGRSRQH